MYIHITYIHITLNKVIIYIVTGVSNGIFQSLSIVNGTIYLVLRRRYCSNISSGKMRNYTIEILNVHELDNKIF